MPRAILTQTEQWPWRCADTTAPQPQPQVAPAVPDKHLVWCTDDPGPVDCDSYNTDTGISSHYTAPFDISGVAD